MTTLAAWKKNATHSVMCPSGTRVEIRIPSLTTMMTNGDLPSDLLDAAMNADDNDTKPTPDLLKKHAEFIDHMVLAMVVEPKLTEADLSAIPAEDKEMLGQIALRNRDIDAEGAHIGGLDKSEKFRRFRGLGAFDTDVEDL